MSSGKANMAASVHQRLLNISKKHDMPFQETLQRYAIERFLLRLSRSEHADRFVLKGAQMLVAWRADRLRPTLDIDLLGYTENSLDHLEAIGRALCEANDPAEDGLEFDPKSLIAVHIKEDADYEGVRLTFPGYLGRAKVPMQIDIGFDDAVTPEPEAVTFPSLLGMAEPQLRGYNRETAVAEKFEAMIKLGEINSRMKDFFDIWALSRGFCFEFEPLMAAVRETCRHRETEIDGMPAILQPDFGGMADKQVQWAAFIKKSRLDCAPGAFEEMTEAIRTFIAPVVAALSEGHAVSVDRWSPPGPWQ